VRCPKCQYIGFDEDDRCRHCGYEFSLAASDGSFDLPIRGASPGDGPFVDLALDDRAGFDERTGPGGSAGFRDRPALEDRPTSPAGPTPRRRVSAQRPTPSGMRQGVTPGFDLPLFEADDDAPLVTAPAVPRPPLSVRRPASPTPRTPLAGATSDADRSVANPRSHRRAADASPSDGDFAVAAVPRAPNGLRVLAAAIDLAIIGGIDLAVVYFTLRVSGLTWAEASGLPIVPLAAFFLLLNGGYATIFTAAAGQTIGKMLAGIRVVPAAPEAETPRLAVSTALVREAACLLSLIPAGVGFLVALVRSDGRALHDALVNTRVVRA
jgi:uncharacterized RDD family membrane protein YckC